MEIEKVNSKDIDLKKALEEKDKALEIALKEKQNLEERITALEEALNNRDLVIYNLAIKISQL